MASVPGSGPRVLVVDDEPLLRNVVRDMLETVAHSVTIASSVSQAIALICTTPIDVVLSDLYMPGEVGTELLQFTASRNHDPAVIIMSGKPEVPDAVASVQMRAADFLIKPFSKTALIQSVERAFKSVQQERSSRILQIDAPAKLLTAVERASIEAFIVALDAAEPDTCIHSLRVREYTMHLAHLAHYPESELVQLNYAALLHDVGKIAIRDTIIDKPGRLTDEERNEVRQHPSKGAEMLWQIDALRPSAAIVLHHHEKYDGSGYPDGIKGKNIPFGARIFAVADTLDAMTSDRCYRSSLGYTLARAEIQACSGTQFDPEIVALFVQVPEFKWVELRERADRLAAHGMTALLQPFGGSISKLISFPQQKETPFADI